ncbi:MAG: hypothetical protein ACI4TL_03485 [Candidatus Cryptobacteroides sp.]
MTKTNYQSPEVKVIMMDAQTVLCQSSYSVTASSIEDWDYEEFVW